MSIKIPSLKYIGEDRLVVSGHESPVIVINPGEIFRIKEETDNVYFIDVPYANEEGDIRTKTFGFTKTPDFYGVDYTLYFEYFEEQVGGN